MKNKVLATSIFIISIILGIVVLKGYLINLDSFIYDLIIKLKCPFFTNVFKVISFLFSTYAVIFYCILILIFLRDKKYSYFICLTMIGEVLLNNIIKIIFKRPRPNILPMVVEKSYSFPSGHTMAATVFIIVMGNYFINKNIKFKKIIIFIEIIIIMLVGISRIYLGVHYFTDILGAFIISYSFLLSFKDDKIITKYLKRGHLNDNKN